MKVTVLHDENGHIIAISKVLDLKHVGSKAVKEGIIPGQGQFTLDVELAEELTGMQLLDLHKHYRVDRVNSKLVKR